MPPFRFVSRPLVTPVPDRDHSRLPRCGHAPCGRDHVVRRAGPLGSVGRPGGGAAVPGRRAGRGRGGGGAVPALLLPFGYVEQVEAAGATAVVLPPTATSDAEVLDRLDAVVFA